MHDNNHRPGRWPDLSDPACYARLRRLAERRLWGYRHHADDIVSRAIIRWAGMSTTTTRAARLEQVIASEVRSFLRSEYRLKAREQRVSLDRSNLSGDQPLHELPLLRAALTEATQRSATTLQERDLTILELLFQGYRISEVADALGVSRYAVTSARKRWQRLLSTAA